MNDVVSLIQKVIDKGRGKKKIYIYIIKYMMRATQVSYKGNKIAL